MRPALLWLILSALAFAAWIGYLAYLVVDLRQRPKEDLEGKSVPVVLSRPQFLIADLVVLAKVKAVEDKPTDAQVIKVVWSRTGDGEQWKDKIIRIDNLAESKGLGEAGEYILPLVNGKERFRVAVTPPSPGYPQGPNSRPHVYPSSPSTQEQMEQILKELHPQ